MKFLAPLHRNPEHHATVVRSNENVVMYDLTLGHEIISYFVGINTHSNETMVEFVDRDDANTFFDKLDIRVAMKKRGICLN